LSGRTEENQKTLPRQPVSGFESGTVQIMAANHTTATAGYYIIIPIIIIIIVVVVVVKIELFFHGLGAIKVHTKAVSASYTTLANADKY
jgi:uncharacterized membrane protein